MQKIQSEADFGRIKPCVFFRQTTLTLHVKHQISTVDKLNNEEQSAYFKKKCTHQLDDSIYPTANNDA
jgi:hypothetical protein